MAKHSVELIQQLKQSLVDHPDAAWGSSALHAYQAVAMLADEIRDMQGKGYTYAMIAEVLGTGGLRISGGTLRNYMSRMGKPQAAQRVVESKPAAVAPVAMPALPTVHGNPGLIETNRSPSQSSARFSPAPDTDDL